MAQFNVQQKKTKYGKGVGKSSQVVSVNFYGALKSKNEIYFQMASLFKEVTQADNDQEEIKLKTEWMKQILISTS